MLCSMALIAFYSDMKPRKRSDPAADPRSAMKRLESVRRVHLTMGLTFVSLSHVALVVKGLLREYIEKYGVATLVPDRKLPLTNKLINAMLAVGDGARRGALVVERAAYYWVSMFALFATLAESGARKDEVSGDRGANGFTFSSLTWKIGGKVVLDPTPQHLAAAREGDCARLAHGVAKNDPVGAFFAATPTSFAWRPAGRCAFVELARLERAAAVRGAARKTTPLFGPSVGAFFTGAQVDAAFLLLLTHPTGGNVGEEEATAYSVHSFRIFLACALLAAKVPRWLIKRMLRWRGDESLEIYARVNDDDWALHGARALEVEVDSTIVPRLPALEFTESEQKRLLDVARSFLNLSAGHARAASAEL
jgi:hypothetical protein